MSLRTLVAAGVYASLVPLVSAVGSGGLPVAAAPFADLEAPTAQSAAPTTGAPAAANSMPIRSTNLARRDPGEGLAAAVREIAATANGPVWAAWTVPAVQSHQRNAVTYSHWQQPDGCVLRDDGRIDGRTGDWQDTTTMVMVARLTAGRIDRVSFVDARCTVDAGTRKVYWMPNVRPADSVRVLTEVVRHAASRENVGGDIEDSAAIAAIALTGDPAADTALASFVAADQPAKLRRDAAFWMGVARGAAGAAGVDRLAASDADESLREHLTFVLTLTGDRGLERLIDMARHDASSGVRRQAVFWLSQKAGERAITTIGRAVNEDPDVEVRKQAVFALSQLPKDEGVPKLIALARTHRNGEVRKQAMFWLGQSGDPRALTLFEELLKP
jgi:HEAT repeat protein